MAELVPEGSTDGELSPAMRQAISEAVQHSVNTAMLRFADHVATKADVQEAVHDLLVSMGGLAAQIEAVRKPVLEGYPGRDAHVAAVPANTDFRIRQEAMDRQPQQTTQERFWDKIAAAGFKRSVQIAVVLVFTVWGTMLDGCNETLRTTKHVVTEVRLAYTGMLEQAAEDAAKRESAADTTATNEADAPADPPPDAPEDDQDELVPDTLDR